MQITGVISALLTGLIVGALGRLVVPGRQHMSIWLTVGIGVVAALLGTVIAVALGVANTPGIDWIEWLLQVGLAALGVLVFVAVRDRSSLFNRRSRRAQGASRPNK